MMTADNLTVGQLLRRAEKHLVQHGVPNARRNAEWMLCETLEFNTLDLYVKSAVAVNFDDLVAYWELVKRRARREPLQHILGNTFFMSAVFKVRPGVFVPRPETEVLVEHATRLLRAVPLHRELSVLDLCCGSGIIGISLADRLANLSVTAVDASPEAVELTESNAGNNLVLERVRLVCEDAFEFLEHTPVRFAAILCNPPYIATGELAGLPPEVRDYEPALALDGGSDGLDFYRRVIPMLRARLAAGGFVMFEIGDTQAAAVSALLLEAGFPRVEITQDLSGRDRVVTAQQESANG
jgi:release factor glutamine methyltransferase